MKSLKSVMELIVLITSALLLLWGAMFKYGVSQGKTERRRMTFIGYLLLLSYIVFIGVPNFLRDLTENDELKKLRKNNAEDIFNSKNDNGY